MLPFIVLPNLLSSHFVTSIPCFVEPDHRSLFLDPSCSASDRISQANQSFVRGRRQHPMVVFPSSMNYSASATAGYPAYSGFQPSEISENANQYYAPTTGQYASHESYASQASGHQRSPSSQDNVASYAAVIPQHEYGESILSLDSLYPGNPYEVSRYREIGRLEVLV